MAEPYYRIRVAAQRSGVSEVLIRAWERRHGVLKPRRTTGRYRVYTEADIELLRRLKTLTEEGVSIGEAVKLLPQLTREVGASAPLATLTGGEQLERWRGEIEAAALSYDQRRLEAVLDEVLASLPATTAVSQLFLPALRELGERWHRGEIDVAGEHVVTQAIRARLSDLIHAAPNGTRGHAVCACFPEEEHEIGLLGAALRLRHAGYRMTYLGPRTPADDLGKLVRKIRPDLVALAAATDPGRAQFKAALSQIMKVLPKGMKVWIGGSAAAVHEKLCLAAGAKTLLDEAAWERAIG